MKKKKSLMVKCKKFLGLNESGDEIIDPKPMALPVNFKKPPTLAEQIRQMVRDERIQQGINQAGYETMDEADDFDIGDDYDPSSPYEMDFDPGNPDLPVPSKNEETPSTPKSNPEGESPEGVENQPQDKEQS